MFVIFADIFDIICQKCQQNPKNIQSRIILRSKGRISILCKLPMEESIFQITYEAMELSQLWWSIAQDSSKPLPQPPAHIISLPAIGNSCGTSTPPMLGMSSAEKPQMRSASSSLNFWTRARASGTTSLQQTMREPFRAWVMA